MRGKTKLALHSLKPLFLILQTYFQAIIFEDESPLYLVGQRFFVLINHFWAMRSHFEPQSTKVKVVTALML